MSYDLRIGVRVHGTDIIAVIDEPELSSPTYNLGKMFRACTGWDFHQGEWYNAAEVLPCIEHGIKELHLNRETYKQYDAPNGWGTTSSAMEALESLRDCIYGDIAGDRTWQAIPVEHLYICW